MDELEAQVRGELAAITSKSNLLLSKSAASAPLDHPYSLSKPSLSADSVLQSNLRALAQG